MVCFCLGAWGQNELIKSIEFGLYVDINGDPIHHMGTIEWEGTAERVAWHPPYILLFDSRFIEIRHVETGRLAQIIPGNDVRCIWDGRGMNHSQAALEGSSDEIVSQQPRIHGMMNTEIVLPGRGVTAQHVFELIPTFLPWVVGLALECIHGRIRPSCSLIDS